MNVAVQLALASAAQGKSIEARLKEAGAVDESSAIAIRPGDDSERAALDQAQEAGIVGRTGEGFYYLNDRAVADRNESHGFVLLVSLLVVVSVVASGLALFLTSR